MIWFQNAFDALIYKTCLYPSIPKPRLDMSLASVARLRARLHFFLTLWSWFCEEFFCFFLKIETKIQMSLNIKIKWDRDWDITLIMKTVFKLRAVASMGSNVCLLVGLSVCGKNQMPNFKWLCVVKNQVSNGDHQKIRFLVIYTL